MTRDGEEERSIARRWDARILTACGWVDVGAAVVALMTGRPGGALVATVLAAVCFRWAAEADKGYRAGATR